MASEPPSGAYPRTSTALRIAAVILFVGPPLLLWLGVHHWNPLTIWLFMLLSAPLSQRRHSGIRISA